MTDTTKPTINLSDIVEDAQLAFWADEAGSYPEDDTQQRANEVWQDAHKAIAKAKGGG